MLPKDRTRSPSSPQGPLFCNLGPRWLADGDQPHSFYTSPKCCRVHKSLSIHALQSRPLGNTGGSSRVRRTANHTAEQHSERAFWSQHPVLPVSLVYLLPTIITMQEHRASYTVVQFQLYTRKLYIFLKNNFSAKD